jgi:hypothetical protein
MKILNKIIGGSIAVAAAFILSASTTQAQNLLVNGSFEDAGGFTAAPITLTSGGIDHGWANFAANSSQNDMSDSLYHPAYGSYALLVQNAPGNNWNPAGAYQIISGITPYFLYTLSMCALTDTGTSWGPNSVDLRLSFLDATLTDLGGTGGWNIAPGNDTWTYTTISAPAPLGAQYAVVYAMFMDNGQTTTENVYFDNVFLTDMLDPYYPYPEPSTLALVGMGLAVQFCFIRRRKS